MTGPTQGEERGKKSGIRAEAFLKGSRLQRRESEKFVHCGGRGVVFGGGEGSKTRVLCQRGISFHREAGEQQTWGGWGKQVGMGKIVRRRTREGRRPKQSKWLAEKQELT